MIGRSRLSWVTALTVACLLIGASALNVLADEQGKGKNSGPGNAEQHQQQTTQEYTSHYDGHDDDHHAAKHDADNDVDDDDLVTPPAHATNDVKPGKGCGDQNHEHEKNDDCKDNQNHGHD